MDYTPTTEEVRNFIPNDPTTWVFIAGEWRHMTREGFDRWLAEVKAQAWEEGKTAGFEDAWGTRAVNPYRRGEN